MAAWLCEAAEPKRSWVTEADYWQNQVQLALFPPLRRRHGRGDHGRVVRWIDMQEIETVRGALAEAAGLAELVKRAAGGPDAARSPSSSKGR